MGIKSFIKKPYIKNTILGLVAIVIGALCSVLGSWDKEQAYFIQKVIFLIILIILYVILMIYYGFHEKNLQDINKELECQIRAYSDAMIGVISVCQKSTIDINKVLHRFKKDGRIDVNLWDFNISASDICRNIYHLLCSLHDSSKGFNVSYVKLLEEKDNDNWICMCAFANRNMSPPKVLNKERNIKDTYCYYDAKLFNKNNSDIIILDQYEDIITEFHFDDRTKLRKKNMKYTQYIAIPVFCNTKMIGLLQIICMNGTKLASSKEALKEVATKYLVPYSYIMLLLHKLEKTLMLIKSNSK